MTTQETVAIGLLVAKMVGRGIPAVGVATALLEPALQNYTDVERSLQRAGATAEELAAARRRIAGMRASIQDELANM